jgi:hypothetical protein
LLAHAPEVLPTLPPNKPQDEQAMNELATSRSKCTG